MLVWSFSGYQALNVELIRNAIFEKKGKHLQEKLFVL